MKKHYEGPTMELLITTDAEVIRTSLEPPTQMGQFDGGSGGSTGW